MIWAITLAERLTFWPPWPQRPLWICSWKFEASVSRLFPPRKMVSKGTCFRSLTQFPLQDVLLVPFYVSKEGPRKAQKVLENLIKTHVQAAKGKAWMVTIIYWSYTTGAQSNGTVNPLLASWDSKQIRGSCSINWYCTVYSARVC